MSTRSWIAHQASLQGKNNGGVVQYVYSHYDGYPSGVGLALLQHYNAKGKALELISGGDISGIEWDGSNVNYYAKRSSWKDSRGGSDENWDDVKPQWKDNLNNLFKVFKTKDAMMIAYLYVWQTDQQWHCYSFDHNTNNINELSMDKDFLIKARKDSTEDVKYIRKAA